MEQKEDIYGKTGENQTKSGVRLSNTRQAVEEAGAQTTTRVHVPQAHKRQRGGRRTSEGFC